jgi:NADH-quinone oxidoreductase subunit C
MTPAEVCQKITDRFGSEHIASFNEKALDPYITVPPASVRDVCRFLKEDPALAFDCLSNMSGVDYLKEGKIQVVLHLYSYVHRHRIVIKADVPRDNPVMPSVESVWKAANWHEREIYDLLGVVFSDHPDLRRLLMPEDWVGHPLRKDFVEPEEYHGISTRRESLLK